jgi:TRAP-type mannitol/chloroaromatic compound transport system permease small subunit
MVETLIRRLDGFAAKTGDILSILPLALVLVQFVIVLLVYVFSSGSIQLQESLQYINAMMFLGAAGYTTLKDEHVRVDLLYCKFSERGKTIVNFCGTLFLLVPFLILFWYASLPYVFDSWAIWESSVESSGLPFIYILKSTLLLFAFTLSLHALADLLRLGRIIVQGKN